MGIPLERLIVKMLDKQPAARPTHADITKLTDVKTGVYSVDLCSAGIGSGKYQLYVQAVGKPSFANRMPQPVPFQAACGQ